MVKEPQFHRISGCHNPPDADLAYAAVCSCCRILKQRLLPAHKVHLRITTGFRQCELSRIPVLEAMWMFKHRRRELTSVVCSTVSIAKP